LCHNYLTTTQLYTLSLHDALPISVILITADHTLPAFRHFQQRDLYRVPLLIHAPGLKEFDEIAKVQVRAADHLDLHNFILRLARSEEHTSELQSRENLVCRLLLEK